jgi:two-component system, sensor histidine kinase and response regulator
MLKMSKILVIEDEALLREEVMEWLVMAGHEVIGAADGLEGVKQALDYVPDVILCDIAMPYLDGYGVMLQVRANAITQMIPFIYMTARVSLDDIRQGMNLGADDYVTKPFTYHQLIQAVERRLEKKAQHELRQQAELEQWQQALEEEQALRLLKSRMVAMFSHDFRNPLATILSSNGILRDHSDRLDPQRRLAFFNRIEASVHRLTQMVDDMLTAAQIESGNLSFKPEPLDLTGFLQQIIEDFQFIYGDTHTLSFKSQLSNNVQVDPRLLRQIAVNLISNAVKYSPRGKEVNISLQHNHHGLELSVQDHGIGIPDTDQQNLFQAFQRASNVGSVAGTGLGLAIVQQAAALHSGTVELESEVDVGTTVTVRLPLVFC